MIKALFRKENLYIRIAIGFAAGILLGLLAPQFSVDTKIIGDIYLNLIRMMIIPVLICAVMTGIMNAPDTASLRRIGLKTVILYIVMFLASFAVSFVVALAIRPGLSDTTRMPLSPSSNADFAAYQQTKFFESA